MWINAANCDLIVEPCSSCKGDPATPQNNLGHLLGWPVLSGRPSLFRPLKGLVEIGCRFRENGGQRYVPYKGLAPALNDLLAGQVQAVFSTMPPAMGHIKSGGLRALAVTSKARYEALPDLPTIGDFLPGYEASITVCLSAPKNIPAGIVDKLNKETNAALADSAVKAKLANLGVVPINFRKMNAPKL